MKRAAHHAETRPHQAKNKRQHRNNEQYTNIQNTPPEYTNIQQLIRKQNLAQAKSQQRAQAKSQQREKKKIKGFE
jgi:hypothetical protein